jgi:hypothetical protein
MASNSFEQQQTLNNGSPMETPTGTPTGTPTKLPLGGYLNESPIRGTSLFGDSSYESSYERKQPPSAPIKKLNCLFDLLEDKTKEKKEEEFLFVPAIYSVDFTKSAPENGIKTPMPQFVKGLKKAGSISPTTAQIPSTKKPIKSGSFFGFSPSSDGSCAIKTATVAGSNGNGTLDKKGLVKIINNTSMCNDSPECAKVNSFHIDHTEKENKANIIIFQELCQPLQIGDCLPFLLCVISLLKWLIKKGFYSTDLKRDNFGRGWDGNVKWFDFDLKKFVSTKACSFIKSGEFQHDGNPMFHQFILMLMDFFRQIEENRKSEFAKINQQKGLLKSLNLLSSEKSISETTIEDFAEVLRNIGLSEQDITYLVGLLTPPASSQ